MSELHIRNREVVVPGTVLATGLDFFPGQGAYRKDENIIANRIGLVSVHGRTIKLIPLAGRYIPKPNDTIVGKVIDVNTYGWRIETNTAYSAMISSKESGSFIPYNTEIIDVINIGEYVAASITRVTSQFLTDATLSGPGLRKLEPGQIFKVNPMKVPRIIGKQGSMISMIKEQTGCQIVVGQNGVVWLRGTPQAEVIARRTILMINDLAHTTGLTERVSTFLEGECKDLDLSAFQAQLEQEREDRRNSRPQGYNRDRDSGSSDGGRRQFRRNFNGNSNGGNRRSNSSNTNRRQS